MGWLKYLIIKFSKSDDKEEIGKLADAIFTGFFKSFILMAFFLMLINDSCEICSACHSCFCKEVYYPPVDVQEFRSNDSSLHWGYMRDTSYNDSWNNDSWNNKSFT